MRKRKVGDKRKQTLDVRIYPYKTVNTVSHQARGSKTCRQATKAPTGRHTKIQVVVHSRTSHKATTPCILTQS